MVAQCAVVLLGVWLMAAPAVLDYAGVAASVDRTVGPVIATFGTIAVAESTRGLRVANIPFGLFLIASPMFLEYRADAAVNSAATGIAVAALACVRGRIRSRFAGGWRVLWRRSADRHA
jgi:hypothetical protein